MARSESQRKNKNKQWRKIQEQFNLLMLEKTPGGASPSSASVIDKLAEEWCVSVHTIEAILRKKL